MALRGTVNARRTLRAGFTTVRNLGLFVKTGGYLLDVALSEAAEAGWFDGPRIVPAGHAICPTGGRLDPRSEEHTSELQSLMRISYAVFCLKKKKTTI